MEAEIVEFYKRKVGNRISFYKYFPERGYAVHVNVTEDKIGKVAESSFMARCGRKRSQKKIKPQWSDVPVYITTYTTEKLFNHHFNQVVQNLM